MPTSQSTGSAARNVRVVYSALIVGIILFALVAHFIMLPGNSRASQFDPTVARGALAVALVLCGLALLLLRGVPRRSAADSPETFWKRAAPMAMRVWAPLEGASLCSVVVYSLSGRLESVAVGLLAVALYLLLNPSYLERR